MVLPASKNPSRRSSSLSSFSPLRRRRRLFIVLFFSAAVLLVALSSVAHVHRLAEEAASASSASPDATGGGADVREGGASGSAAEAAGGKLPPPPTTKRLPPGSSEKAAAAAATGEGGGGEKDAVRGAADAAAAAETERKLFTPEEFKSGNRDAYVNLPAKPFSAEVEARVKKAMDATPAEPYGLMHRSHPPGRDVVMGLAAYPRNMGTFQKLVGGLRNVGYDGHIILGVHSEIPDDEQEYLKRMDVTYYAVEMIPCDPSILDKDDGGEGNIRGKCSKGLETLKLEWGRFEMARQWLRACAECTGWAMVMDTRDIFFQSHPFKSLPDPSSARKELLFVEEISKHTCPVAELCQEHRYYIIDNGRYKGRTEPCYGNGHWVPFGDRPVLCSGTVLGTRSGIHRFLSVLVDEFHANNAKAEPQCRSPHATDQWTMDYLYYTGAFGHPDRTATLPWGTGPVLTIGHACINTKVKPEHSQMDLTQFDKAKGWVLNIHEKDGSEVRVAPAVHQYDRCHTWIGPWFAKHKDIYYTEVAVPWKKR